MSVVGIRDGIELRPPGEADPLVVAELERLLEMARSGELAGLAVALYWRDEATSYVLSGPRTRALIGALEEAKFRILRDFESER